MLPPRLSIRSLLRLVKLDDEVAEALDDDDDALVDGGMGGGPAGPALWMALDSSDSLISPSPVASSVSKALVNWLMAVEAVELVDELLLVLLLERPSEDSICERLTSPSEPPSWSINCVAMESAGDDDEEEDDVELLLEASA